MDKNKGFIKGAAILGAAGLLCKLIGAFYRIPLTNIIGEEAIGIYQKAYPIYAFLLVLSTSGIPIAISKLVAERTAQGDFFGAQRTFQNAFYMLLGIGSITTFLMLIFASPIASGLGISNGSKVITALAPSLLMVSLISAYRGYFQGMQRMTPTAVTQITEQLFKLLAGFAFAILWLPKGAVYAASGALLGITISEAIAFIVMLLTFQKARPALVEQVRKAPKSEQVSGRALRKRLLKIAVPITLGGAIMPLVDIADALVVTWVMKGLHYSEAQINGMYGVLKGMVNSLINMPAVITLALAMSLVPAISESISAKRQQEVKKCAFTGLKISINIGLASCVGLFVLARPILLLLYRSRSEESIALGTSLLQMMSFSILFLSVVQATTGILQGLGKIILPIRNLFIGVAIKLAVSFMLISIPSFNIKGAAVSTGICYAVAALLNVYDVVKYTRLRFDFKEMILRPITAAFILWSVLFAANVIKGAFHLNSSVITLIIIAISAIIYVCTVLLLGIFNKEDFELIPGGSKAEKLVSKYHVLKSTKDRRM